jgi:hypothetical protein
VTSNHHHLDMTLHTIHYIFAPFPGGFWRLDVENRRVRSHFLRSTQCCKLLIAMPFITSSKDFAERLLLRLNSRMHKPMSDREVAISLLISACKKEPLFKEPPPSCYDYGHTSSNQGPNRTYKEGSILHYWESASIDKK